MSRLSALAQFLPKWASLRFSFVLGLFFGAELMAGWTLVVLYAPDVARDLIAQAGGMM